MLLSGLTIISTKMWQLKLFDNLRCQILALKILNNLFLIFKNLNQFNLFRKNFIRVSDDYFYDLVSSIFGSRNIYNVIREDLIRRIFKIYTSRYPSIYGDKDPEHVIFLERDIE